MNNASRTTNEQRTYHDCLELQLFAGLRHGDFFSALPNQNWAVLLTGDGTPACSQPAQILLLNLAAGVTHVEHVVSAANDVLENRVSLQLVSNSG